MSVAAGSRSYKGGGSRLNPLTYEVDALRHLMLAGGTSVFGIAVDLEANQTKSVWRKDAKRTIGKWPETNWAKTH
jgi:hypothetical protein